MVGILGKLLFSGVREDPNDLALLLLLLELVREIVTLIAGVCSRMLIGGRIRTISTRFHRNG
jgi:hypothetical protein